ncbi:MAG: DUF1700 domain-containing protein [Lachnospiraceae bacterium]|nr:DUF1700 domain-containing protein [Lachnospiraceae bacterium]
MTAEIFLNELREALNGSISPSSVNDNIRYYEEYIETEKRKGRSEEEIMEELGEPRLIARTIIDTADVNDKRGVNTVYEDDNGEWQRDDSGSGENVYGNRVKYTRISGAKALLVIAVILIVFFAIFTLALWLVGSFILAFWPAILVAIVIWWILNPLRG